jgi:hypothetical protein
MFLISVKKSRYLLQRSFERTFENNDASENRMDETCKKKEVVLFN